MSSAELDLMHVVQLHLHQGRISCHQISSVSVHKVFFFMLVKKRRYENAFYIKLYMLSSFSFPFFWGGGLLMGFESIDHEQLIIFTVFYISPSII